jgi:hypothetical protein
MVKFTATNTAAAPTLNVNGTGAKAIYYNDAIVTSSSSTYGGYADRVTTYAYDGTNWVWLSNSYDANSDTKVTQNAAITTAGEYPVALAYSTSTSKVTNVLNKTSTLKYNPSTKILTAPTFKGDLDGTATNATNDEDGNNITDTYETKANAITGLSVSGKTITYTKGDGTTGTLTTQDTNTTSFTITATATDDDVVVLTGTNGTNKVTFDAKHAKKGPSAGYTSGNTTTSISGSAGTGVIKIPQLTVDAYGHVTAAADENVTITMPTLPSAAGTSLGLVKSGGDVTISSGTITVNDDSHNHVISNIDNLQTNLDNKLSLSGGNMTGHIYLTGAKPTSSTGNTSQIIFGTPDSEHVAISSNEDMIVINPSSASTTG